MLTGASEKAVFDLSHEETVGVFYVEEWGGTPQAGDQHVQKLGDLKVWHVGEQEVIQDDQNVRCMEEGQEGRKKVA